MVLEGEEDKTRLSLSQQRFPSQVDSRLDSGRKDTKTDGMYHIEKSQHISLIEDQLIRVEKIESHVYQTVKDLKFTKIKQSNIVLGGRLKFFEENWSKITSDNKILESIRSYTIEFLEKPVQTQTKISRFTTQEMLSLDQEISEMIQKGAIEEVTVSDQDQFLSHLFIRPKKDGVSDLF